VALDERVHGEKGLRVRRDVLARRQRDELRKRRQLVEPRRARATAEPENVPTPEPTPDSELRLEAVSRRDGQPVAVLSGRLVHEGDAFDNVRVLRIGETEVELEVDGQRRVLSF
jgi:hypothetical protein